MLPVSSITIAGRNPSFGPFPSLGAEHPQVAGVGATPIPQRRRGGIIYSTGDLIINY
jgi:hypothetical protein